MAAFEQELRKLGSETNAELIVRGNGPLTRRLTSLTAARHPLTPALSPQTGRGGRESKMGTPKQAVLDLLKGFPEDVSFEDIQYHLRVLQKAHKGMKDEEEGRTLSQDEMEKQFEKWLVK